MTNRKSIQIHRSLAFHIFSIVLGFFMIYPLLWLIASSFKSNSTMFVDSYSLIPQEWDIAENYRSGWQGISGIHFGRFLANTVFVTVVGTVTCVFSSLLAAYAFSRTPFKGIRLWFTCVILTMMIPPQVMVVPQYIILKNIGLIDTLAALILPWCFGTAFFIFLMLQFFRSIPKELDEFFLPVILVCPFSYKYEYMWSLCCSLHHIVTSKNCNSGFQFCYHQAFYPDFYRFYSL